MRVKIDVDGAGEVIAGHWLSLISLFSHVISACVPMLSGEG